MKKSVQYILGIIVLLLVLFFSVKVENLDKYKAENSTVKFDAQLYTEEIWNTKLPACAENASEISEVFKALNDDPKAALEKFGRKLGISSTYYLVLKGGGTIEYVEQEFIVVSINNALKVKIATDFIFGNAVRDGSGVVNIDEFINMTDFNNVSVAINKMIKEKLVLPLKTDASAGMNLKFAGAIEIKEDKIDLNTVRIIPISAKLSDGNSEE